MARGINIEDLRTQLESDATKRNVVQEKTIQEQINKIKILESNVVEYKQNFKALTNRCYVLSHGALCAFCEFITCERRGGQIK